jgi:hypothetical protein
MDTLKKLKEKFKNLQKIKIFQNYTRKILRKNLSKLFKVTNINQNFNYITLYACRSIHVNISLKKSENFYQTISKLFTYLNLRTFHNYAKYTVILTRKMLPFINLTHLI